MFLTDTDFQVDELDRALDKGIVIEGWRRVYPCGVDIGAAMESRAVVASLDTYLARGELIQFLTDREPALVSQRVGARKTIKRSVPSKFSRRAPHSRRSPGGDRVTDGSGLHRHLSQVPHPPDWDECPSMGGRIRMVRISCDVCGRVKKPADQQWILGYDLEVETRSGLHRTVQFLDRWYDRRAPEFGAIHLCSEKCRENYLEESRAAA